MEFLTFLASTAVGMLICGTLYALIATWFEERVKR